MINAGQASLSCVSIAIGGLGALDEPLSAVVVQSPSSHCTRLLATADLHAAASRVQTKPAKTPGSFLVVKFGRGSANADNHAVRQQGKKKSLLWEMLQPSGMEIDVEAAGIEVQLLACPAVCVAWQQGRYGAALNGGVCRTWNRACIQAYSSGPPLSTSIEEQPSVPHTPPALACLTSSAAAGVS